jgi:signal transduction histidine kinase
LRSIERDLLGWTLGALSLGAVLIVLVTYAVTLDEMDEVFDADLRNVAQALGAHQRASGPGEQAAAPRQARQPPADPAEILTVTWTPEGQRIFSSDPTVALPFRTLERLERLRVGNDIWVVYTDVSANGVAQAAQRLGARHLAAAESAAQILLPMLVLVLGVAALLVVALRRGLRPLDLAAQDVASRTAASLAPIAIDKVPAEIRPLVGSINGLMARLATVISQQQSFLADAAHALRTPVTALRLQLQLLQRAPDAQARADAIAELGAGIERSQHLIEQLMDVARFGPEGARSRLVPVDLGALVRQVVGALSAKAAQRQLDLGAAADAGVVVDGDADALAVLLNNLVENALRYTPAGGVVDVVATRLQGRPVLQVIDDGPGIPEAERVHVFGRFQRGTAAQALAREPGGCGLGLAIVQGIAERHGAQVSLHDAPSGRGLAVQVLFSASAEAG